MEKASITATIEVNFPGNVVVTYKWEEIDIELFTKLGGVITNLTGKSFNKSFSAINKDLDNG